MDGQRAMSIFHHSGRPIKAMTVSCGRSDCGIGNPAIASTAFAASPHAVHGAFHMIGVSLGGRVPLPRPKPVVETQTVFEKPFFKARAAFEAAIESVGVPALDAKNGWYAPKTVSGPAPVPVASTDAWPCRMKEYLPDYSEIFEANCPNATMVASAGNGEGSTARADAIPEQPILRLGLDIHPDAGGRP
jgi:hypothetical protein